MNEKSYDSPSPCDSSVVPRNPLEVRCVCDIKHFTQDKNIIGAPKMWNGYFSNIAIEILDFSLLLSI